VYILSVLYGHFLSLASLATKPKNLVAKQKNLVANILLDFIIMYAMYKFNDVYGIYVKLCFLLYINVS
jgi:hypothetical protein